MKNNFFKSILILILILVLPSCKAGKIEQYKIYGIDYLENSNYEEALLYFDKAIDAGEGQVGKTQYDLMLYKAECLYMLKRYTEAKNIYEILLKVDKNNKTYQDLYASVNSVASLVEFKNALDNNQLDDAERILQELKDAGFEHERSVIFNQAVLYEKKGEWKNALSTFTYYLKQYPDDEDAMHEVEFINSQINYVNN